MRKIIFVLMLVLSLPLVVSQASVTPGAAAVGSDSLSQASSSTLNIIHIGDSHVAGSYGYGLHQLLLPVAAHRETYGCVGASASWYTAEHSCNPSLGSRSSIDQKTSDLISTINFPDYIKKNNFDVAIISLGTNFRSGDVVTGNERESVEKLLDAATLVEKCFWVGAPVTKDPNVNPNTINTALKTLVENKGCKFIDSTDFTSTPNINEGSGSTKNLLHFNSVGGKSWASGVCGSIINDIAPGTTLADCIGEQTEDPEPVNVERDEFVPDYSQQTGPTPTITEIDQVWQQISGVLKINHMLDVWVPKLGWQSVQPVVPKDAPITATTAGITGSDNDIQALAKIYRTYGSAVEAAAIFHTVEPSLIMAIIYKESLGRVDAVSSSGAVGLMQLVAGTARDAGLNVPEYNRITITLSSGREINVPEHCRSIDVTGCDKVNDERFDPTKNILAGARSLRVFFDSKTRGGSWEKAIKRYRGSTDDIQQAYYNKVVQYQAIAEQIIRQGGSAVSPVSTDALCFPLTQESLNTNKGRNGDNDDWGNSRSEGDRCHAGNDLFEQGPGEVIAITDGTVVAIQKGWTRCEDGWGGTAGTPKGVSAVLVYHPSLGKTINYGEIDDDKVEVNVGGQISKGQFLGVVSYCDTFHLEVYNGEQRTTIKWEPPKGQTVSGGNTKDYCEQNYFNTKPAALEDPQVLLRQIKGNFCEKDTGKFLVQAPIVPTPEATLASIPTGASASSCSNDENFVDPSKSTRANLYKDKWVKALGDAGVHGTTFVSKLQSNGPEDQNLLNEKGRLTLVFAPCSTDFNKPIEMVYYFHGNNGFSYQDGSGAYDDFNKRLAPQIKKMMDAGRNFVIVFPELPWSAGDNPGVSKKNHGKVWADGDSNLVALHNDVLRLLNLRFSNVVVGYISMTGHSGGGSPLKRGVEVGAIQELNVNKITFSDADYGWQGSGSSSLYVYNNYVKDHPNVELNLLVQAPANIGVHEPTKYSVDFVKQIGGSTVSDWSTPGSCENSRCKDLIKTPGVGSSNDGSYVFFVPGHENIAYVPLTLGHTTIGTISLAWQRPSPSTTVASN